MSTRDTLERRLQDAYLIVNHLLVAVIFFEHGEELYDIAVVIIKLISGAVETENEGATAARLGDGDHSGEDVVHAAGARWTGCGGHFELWWGEERASFWPGRDL